MALVKPPPYPGPFVVTPEKLNGRSIRKTMRLLFPHQATAVIEWLAGYDPEAVALAMTAVIAEPGHGAPHPDMRQEGRKASKAGRGQLLTDLEEKAAARRSRVAVWDALRRQPADAAFWAAREKEKKEERTP